MEKRRLGWIFPFLIGTLTASAVAAVLAIVWTLVSLVGSPLWVDERVAMGRVGTFIVLRGILPAIAAGLGIWVGLASARNRSTAPHVSLLAVFVLAVGASQALLGLPELQMVPTPDGNPSLPGVITELLSYLGTVSTLLAIGAFVQLSRVYGDQGVRLIAWPWRVMGSGWVWALLVLTFLGSSMLDEALRGTPADFLGYAPWYALLVLCGARLWRVALASSEDTRNRGIWLIHGALGFLLGVVIFRKAFEGGGTAAFHLWSLPSTLGTLFAVLAVAYAVFFRGAAGPNLILRTGSLYGVGGGFAVFLFAGLEEVFSSWLTSLAGLPSSLGSFAAAGVVALVVTGLRGRLPRTGLRFAFTTAADQAPEVQSPPGTT